MKIINLFFFILLGNFSLFQNPLKFSKKLKIKKPFFWRSNFFNMRDTEIVQKQSYSFRKVLQKVSLPFFDILHQFWKNVYFSKHSKNGTRYPNNLFFYCFLNNKKPPITIIKERVNCLNYLENTGFRKRTWE